MKTAAQRMQKAKSELRRIGFTPSEFSEYLNQSFVGFEKRADDTLCAENLIAL